MRWLVECEIYENARPMIDRTISNTQIVKHLDNLALSQHFASSDLVNTAT